MQIPSMKKKIMMDQKLKLAILELENKNHAKKRKNKIVSNSLAKSKILWNSFLNIKPSIF
jgi:uncharacterized membrane protein